MHSKSGRLVSAERRLMASEGSLPLTVCPKKHGNCEMTLKSSLIFDIKYCMSDELFVKWSTLLVHEKLDIKTIFTY